MAAAVHSGSSNAAVPRLTRRQPPASAASRLSASRIPPDSSTLMSSRPTMLASSSRLEPRPKAASRSTRWIHSAPWSCHAFAASHGSPNSPPVPATPCTSWTARPPATSTAGRSSRRGALVTADGFPCGCGWSGGWTPQVRRATPAGQGSQRRDPVAHQLGPGVAGLLGVELGGPQRAVLDRGDETGAVLGPGDLGRDGGEDALRLEVPALDGVGVDEVEPFALHAGEQPGALGDVDLRPPHVRHHPGGEPV